MGFQSPPPRRGRPWRCGFLPILYGFQSPPPRRGRPGVHYTIYPCQNFNPRPRAGGDHLLDRILASGKGISIPAPAQGATVAVGHPPGAVLISIPAPAQGATLQRFRPTGGRLFQSPPPRRGRPCSTPRAVGVRAFQSPPPRRGRRDIGGYTLRGYDFNPRPRAGGDTSTGPFGPCFRISIPAPAQGATEGPGTRLTASQFQSPPPRRGRRPLDHLRRELQNFNPRPRAGGDAEHPSDPYA